MGLTNVSFNVRYFVHEWALIAAAIEVKCDPNKRLSKSSVIALLKEWYENYGDQMDAMDEADLNLEWSTELTPGQQEKLEQWIRKTFSGALDA